MEIQDYLAISIVAAIIAAAILKTISAFSKPPKDECGCGKKCHKKTRRNFRS